jgi:hypothetical protein
VEHPLAAGRCNSFPIPTGAFAALTFVVTVLAFVMRIKSQKDFRDE